MKYTTFRKKLVESVSAEIDDRGLKDISLELKTINSPDGMNDRLVVSVEDSKMSMAFRIEELFKDYEKSETLKAISRRIVSIIEENTTICKTKEQEVKAFITDYSKVKNNLFLRLVPGNSPVLQDSPHRMIEDLAVVVCVHMNDLSDDNGKSVLIVSNPLLDLYGIDEEQLFDEAEKNSMSKEPMTIKPLADMVKNIVSEDASEDNGVFPYVVSNKSGFMGASVLAYPGAFEIIAKTIGGSYFVLPSSSHEIIVLKDDMNANAKDLDVLVKKVNKTIIEPRDYLADQCYHFDAKKKKFETGIKYEANRPKEYVYDLYNDYSYLEFRNEFIKRPLEDVVKDTRNYHNLTVFEAGVALNKLNKLPIKDYFKYMPECIESLSELPEFNLIKDIDKITVGDCFTIICGVKEDYSEDYSKIDFYSEAANLLLQPVLDSNYEHPLYSNCLKDVYEAAYLSTGEECFAADILKEELRDVSMNSLLRMKFDNYPEECKHAYFNHIVRTGFALDREERLHPDR